MNAFLANLINSIVLIAMGLWAYLTAEDPSVTALIPVFFGVILLIMSQGIRKENKVIAHIAVVLTLLILVALVKPLTAAMGRDDSLAIIRVVIMMVTSALAMLFFIKSFIDARKKRA